jgi:glycosyltransferase involved in cell wall biosynthesis
MSVLTGSAVREEPRARPVTRPLKVAVLTTSYPRHADDFAGRFIADAVGELRARGHRLEVVSPGVYEAWGLAVDGGGFVRNLKRRPWAAPFLFVSMVRALRRASRDADVVHVHWLAGALVAAFCGRPFVVTLHGTGSAGRFQDLELMRRWPRLVGLVLRRARVVIGVSPQLAEAAARCGVPDARWIPNGVVLPDGLGDEAAPAEVLFVGRLAPEKGIRDLVEATEGMNVVVAGDGPLRGLLPGALGFVPHAEVERLYRRAALVVCSSHREGLPLSVIEAMAHGRPVVATAVGGIPSLVDDGRTGFLVPPGDAHALREKIQLLLADAGLRLRMGRAGREKVEGLCSWERVTELTVDAYVTAARDGLGGKRSRGRRARRGRRGSKTRAAA